MPVTDDPFCDGAINSLSCVDSDGDEHQVLDSFSNGVCLREFTTTLDRSEAINISIACGTIPIVSVTTTGLRLLSALARFDGRESTMCHSPLSA